MGRFGRCVAVLLAALFVLAPVAPALASDSVVTNADLERAMAVRQQGDDAARASVRGLLARADVKAAAASAGLDLRRAQSAVATLDGDELRTLASQAAAVNQELAGGTTIQISLVTALLIVIIILLIAD